MTSIESTAETKRRLLKTICRIIGDFRVGDTDDAISLEKIGLDSMQLAELADELHSEYGIGLEAFSKEVTLNQLVDRLRDAAQDRRRDQGSTSKPSPRDKRFDIADEFGALVLPRHSFDPLPLSPDDWVPNPLEILLVYAGDVRMAVYEVMRSGLEAFPHLSGVIQFDAKDSERAIGKPAAKEALIHTIADASDQRAATVVPRSLENGRTRIEFRERPDFSPEQLSRCTRSEIRNDFLPQPNAPPSDRLVEAPLLAARITSMKAPFQVVALRISHRVVDGTGLALFLQAGLRGWNRSRERETMGHQTLEGPDSETAAVEVTKTSLTHDRSCLQQVTAPDASFGSGYTDQPCNSPAIREWELSKQWPTYRFRVDQDSIDRVAGVSPWFVLTAKWASWLAKNEGFQSAAFWCDLRGSLAIPRGFTGNVGCYWHEPIRLKHETLGDLSKRFQKSTSTLHNARIAETYSALKYGEKVGRPIHWMGTEREVLPINLLPFPTSVLNFGQGPPERCWVLTRNVHGLRVSRSSNDSTWIVEACLHEDTLERLNQNLQSSGLGHERIHVW